MAESQQDIFKMDQTLYSAAMKNQPEFVTGKSSDYFYREVSPKGNTALHIAARFGHSEFAVSVLHICPHLLSAENRNGDSPLHVAARGGHLQMVKALTGKIRSSGEVAPLQLKNKRGNTPLHEAVKNSKTEVSLHLLGEYQEAASEVNGVGESPLFMAAELGLEITVKKILEKSPLASSQGRMGMNALHGAAGIPNTGGIIRLLLERRSDSSELIKQIDEHGRTALHYAATNNMEVCDLLLKKDRSIAYIPDNNGFTPFLIAIQIHHLGIALKILDNCPDCAEIQDLNGCNALHFLLRIGRWETIIALLNRPEIKELINEADVDGNTPIHLATKYRFYRAVKAFIHCDGVDLNARNNSGQTPMDIVEADWELSFRQIKIWNALHSSNAPRSQLDINSPCFRSIFNHPHADLKPMAKTMSIVATLLATVTFAVAFSVPGGYITDGKNKGSPILSISAAFRVFIIADTIALCCSVTVIFSLIWALIGDPCFLMTMVIGSLVLLWVAVFGTLIAFVTAVYATIARDNKWLAIVVCAMGCCVPLLVLGWFHIATIASPYHRLWLDTTPDTDSNPLQLIDVQQDTGPSSH